jgi:hypothetical protein
VCVCVYGEGGEFVTLTQAVPEVCALRLFDMYSKHQRNGQ